MSIWNHQMESPVDLLLGKLFALDKPLLSEPVKTSADVCLSVFKDYLDDVKKQHCKRDYKDDYLVQQVFRHRVMLRGDHEKSAYCRSHLFLAVNEFRKLLTEMRGSVGRVGYKTFRAHRHLLVDYVVGLKSPVEYLERKKNPDFVFFNGYKNTQLSARDAFCAATQLRNSSVSQVVNLDHMSAQIASVFMLRQALELKFERLIGVYLHDRQATKPKVDHWFHYNFIKHHIDFYEFRSVDFSLLRRIYGWCSSIVHSASQPQPWQLSYAFEVCNGLFKGGGNDGAWSIDGGIFVKDQRAMQATYLAHVLDHFPNNIWCIDYGRLEALTGGDDYV